MMMFLALFMVGPGVAAREASRVGGFDAGEDRIVNFAPLEYHLNTLAKNTPCSNKLIQAPGTPHIYHDVSLKHPYCKWLVGPDHAGKIASSDLEE